MNFDNIKNLEKIITDLQTNQTQQKQQDLTSPLINQELGQIRSYLENVISNMSRYEINIDNIDVDNYKKKLQDTQSKLTNIKFELDKLLN